MTWTTARRLMQAGPADHLLAMSVASAQLPIVGKHLEPLGALSAMSVWGVKQMPELLGAAAKSLLTPHAGRARRVQRESTREVSEAGLRGIVLPEDLQIDWPAPDTKPPVARALEHRKHLYLSLIHI